jgi:uncharacterized protein with gpF-like domain
LADLPLTRLQPDEAIRFLESKRSQSSFHYLDVFQEEHAHIFTVPKVMDLDLLELIRQHVEQSLREGTTFWQFRKELTPKLQKAGWWGRKEMTDPLTGKTKTVQLGSPNRLKVIFDNNLRAACAAGRWQRIQRNKARRPYLRYLAFSDNYTHPQHLEWGTMGGQGIILPVDHPFWNTHFPPNCGNCRCIVMQLSEVDLTRRGWKMSEECNVADLMQQKRTFTNTRTGKVVQVFQGIELGYAFNIGKAYLDRLND